MDIIVLAGGLSTERDVSFKTGSMVASALKENGHRVILLDVFMGYSDKEENLDGIFDRADEIRNGISSLRMYGGFDTITSNVSSATSSNRLLLSKTAAANLPWICVRDGNGVYSTNVAVYNVRQVPSIFLINRNNELKLRGEDIKDLEAAVKSLL